jgi:hypothetical protein
MIRSGVGRNGAANMGLKEASGEYMMFLDYDDLLFADHIESLIYALKSTKNCSAAIGQSWIVYTKYRNNNYFESDYRAYISSNMKEITHKLLPHFFTHIQNATLDTLVYKVTNILVIPHPLRPSKPSTFIHLLNHLPRFFLSSIFIDILQ